MKIELTVEEVNIVLECLEEVKYGERTYQDEKEVIDKIIDVITIQATK